MKLQQVSSLQLKLADKGLLIIAVPLVIEFLLLLSLSFLIGLSDQQAKRLDTYRNIMASADTLAKLYTDAANCLIFYGTMKTEESSVRYNETAWKITQQIDLMRDTIPLIPQHRRSLERALVLAEEELVLLDKTKSLISSTSGLAVFTKLKAMPSSLGNVSNQLVDALSNFVQEIKDTEKISPEDAERVKTIVRLNLLLGLAVSALFIFCALTFYKGMTNRLELLMDNTNRLVGKKPLHPVLAGSDEIAKLDEVFHDMADALAEAARKEEELQKVKQQFVAMLSHDLRTPLTSMQVFLGVLALGSYGQLNEHGLQRSNTALTGVKRLIGMVNDLLDIDKMEAGMMELHLEEVKLQPIFEQAVESVHSFAELGKVQIVVTATTLEATADSERILRVLTNLLGNAIKFSPAETTITLSADSADGWVEVRVADQGRGIPQNQKDSVFDRFHQVEVADSRAKGGAGLGLAICKAIVEAHGGRIGVDSEEGQGSTFWFRLPPAREGNS